MREGAARANTMMGSEGGGRLSIDKDGESSSGNTSLNEVGEIGGQPKTI